MEEHIREENQVVSDRVQGLARGIYQEFERMIRKYDEDVVKSLMPLVVSLLENLESTHLQSEESKIELELLKEDNEQLMTQYEREKQLKRSAEQKYFEVEDAIEGERKDYKDRIESLESLVHIFELKTKNAADHTNRLEEKEYELKKDYQKLHERYTELFKTHMDYMERSKFLSKPCKDSAQSPSANSLLHFKLNPQESIVNLQPNYESANLENHDFISDMDLPRIWNDQCNQEMDSLSVNNKNISTNNFSEGHGKESGYSGDNISVHEASEENSDKESVKSNASDNIFAMGKEVENLIEENNELLATKNALNIVKDDLIAKVDELSSEHEILREEIRSLQEIKEKMREKIAWLEEELKAVREQLRQRLEQSDQEENVPLSLRKRFTRVEMARVLLERNEYKERLLELQDAVRWTEMIKASRLERGAASSSGGGRARSGKSATSNYYKKGSSIWNFFSDLFGTSSHSSSDPSSGCAIGSRGKGDCMAPQVSIKYDSPSSKLTPRVTSTSMYNIQDKGSQDRNPRLKESTQPGLLLDRDMLSDKMRAAKTRLNRDRMASSHDPLMFKLGRAVPGSNGTAAAKLPHNVDDVSGRLQAYGWSLPARTRGFISQFYPPVEAATTDSLATSFKRGSNKNSVISIPIPTYCRPLSDIQPGSKLWCASGVNLSGGQTRDGGDIFGASVFYNDGLSHHTSQSSTFPFASVDHGENVKHLEAELEQNAQANEASASLHPVPDSSAHYFSSSFVWICTSGRQRRKDASPLPSLTPPQPPPSSQDFGAEGEEKECASVTVIDAREPADILETFAIPALVDVVCIISVPGTKSSDYGMGENADDIDDSFESSQIIVLTPAENGQLNQITPSPHSNDFSLTDQTEPPNLACNNALPPTKYGSKSSLNNRFPSADNSLNGGEGVDGSQDINTLPMEEAEKMTTLLPTMWLGSQNGIISIHSSVSQWNKSLHYIQLKDSILSILHHKGRVFVSLADGTVAVFKRTQDGQWDTGRYHLLKLSPISQAKNESTDKLQLSAARCLTLVSGQSVWCGCQNNVYVIQPAKIAIVHSFAAHPRKESQIRQMQGFGDGVWVSIRLDSTLRLFHAHNYTHLQDIDVQPYVSRMLGSNALGFSFVRITSMLISCYRLWIGTGNGCILAIPFSTESEHKLNTSKSSTSQGGGPGLAVRLVYKNPITETLTPGTFIPYCDMANAQFSFHGHKDSVKFFVAVPNNNENHPITMDQDRQIANKLSETSLPVANYLVISGGEGYVDFRMNRIADMEEEICEVADDNLGLGGGADDTDRNVEEIEAVLVEEREAEVGDTSIRTSNMATTSKRRATSSLPLKMATAQSESGEMAHLIVWQVAVPR